MNEIGFLWLWVTFIAPIVAWLVAHWIAVDEEITYLIQQNRKLRRYTRQHYFQKIMRRTVAPEEFEKWADFYLEDSERK